MRLFGPPEKQNADGWTDWLKPKLLPHKIACCDCGLVHQFEFDVDHDGEVIFRARRDNRSTGQRRRYAFTAERERK